VELLIIYRKGLQLVSVSRSKVRTSVAFFLLWGSVIQSCLGFGSFGMISINSISACLIVALSIYLLLCNDEFDSRNYEIKGDSGIWLPESTNAGGHVYPYMATIVSMTCLLTLVMIIICFGSQFTG
jgi:hypothetical protein